MAAKKKSTRKKPDGKVNYFKLPRKSLQSLCKKHGFPANKTNLVMAEFLTGHVKPDEELCIDMFPAAGPEKKANSEPEEQLNKDMSPAAGPEMKAYCEPDEQLNKDMSPAAGPEKKANSEDTTVKSPTTSSPSQSTEGSLEEGSLHSIVFKSVITSPTQSQESGKEALLSGSVFPSGRHHPPEFQVTNLDGIKLFVDLRMELLPTFELPLLSYRDWAGLPTLCSSRMEFDALRSLKTSKGARESLQIRKEEIISSPKCAIADEISNTVLLPQQSNDLGTQKSFLQSVSNSETSLQGFKTKEGQDSERLSDPNMRKKSYKPSPFGRSFRLTARVDRSLELGKARRVQILGSKREVVGVFSITCSVPKFAEKIGRNSLTILPVSPVCTQAVAAERILSKDYSKATEVEALRGDGFAETAIVRGHSELLLHKMVKRSLQRREIGKPFRRFTLDLWKWLLDQKAHTAMPNGRVLSSPGFSVRHGFSGEICAILQCNVWPSMGLDFSLDNRQSSIFGDQRRGFQVWANSPMLSASREEDGAVGSLRILQGTEINLHPASSESEKEVQGIGMDGSLHVEEHSNAWSEKPVVETQELFFSHKSRMPLKHSFITLDTFSPVEKTSLELAFLTRNSFPVEISLLSPENKLFAPPDTLSCPLSYLTAQSFPVKFSLLFPENRATLELPLPPDISSCKLSFLTPESVQMKFSLLSPESKPSLGLVSPPKNPSFQLSFFTPNTFPLKSSLVSPENSLFTEVPLSRPGTIPKTGSIDLRVEENHSSSMVEAIVENCSEGKTQPELFEEGLSDSADKVVGSSGEHGSGDDELPMKKVIQSNSCREVLQPTSRLHRCTRSSDSCPGVLTDAVHKSEELAKDASTLNNRKELHKSSPFVQSSLFTVKLESASKLRQGRRAEILATKRAAPSMQAISPSLLQDKKIREDDVGSVLPLLSPVLSRLSALEAILPSSPQDERMSKYDAGCDLPLLSPVLTRLLAEMKAAQNSKVATEIVEARPLEILEPGIAQTADTNQVSNVNSSEAAEVSQAAATNQGTSVNSSEAAEVSWAAATNQGTSVKSSEAAEVSETGHLPSDSEVSLHKMARSTLKRRKGGIPLRRFTWNNFSWMSDVQLKFQQMKACLRSWHRFLRRKTSPPPLESVNSMTRPLIARLHSSRIQLKNQ